MKSHIVPKAVQGSFEKTVRANVCSYCTSSQVLQLWQIPQQNRSKTFYEIALVSVLIDPTRYEDNQAGIQEEREVFAIQKLCHKEWKKFKKKRRKICFSRKKINTGIMQGLLIGAVDNQSSFKYQVLYNPFHGLLTNQKLK